MNIMSKSQLDAIRKDIDSALAEVGKKHGIESIKIGTIRHDADGFKSSLEARYEGGEDLDMKTLRQNAKYIGFKDSIINATISYANKQCKVVGMKRTKLLIVIDGKNYSASIDDVQKALKQQNSEHLIVHVLTEVPSPKLVTKM